MRKQTDINEYKGFLVNTETVNGQEYHVVDYYGDYQYFTSLDELKAFVDRQVGIETVNLNELAKRIVNVSDLYDVMDAYGSIDEADKAITNDLVNDPITVIVSLVGMIEDLQNEL